MGDEGYYKDGYKGTFESDCLTKEDIQKAINLLEKHHRATEFFVVVPWTAEMLSAEEYYEKYGNLTKEELIDCIRNRR